MLMDAGDLLVATDDGSMLCIERKTASDFLNTLRDDRLMPQMLGIRSLTPWAYIAICGDLRCGQGGKALVDGRESGWNWSSVQGALLTVQEIGVNVVWVPNDYDFETTVLRLGNRDRSTVHVGPARNLVALSEAETILMSLPGIGPEKAQELMRYTGSAAWALWYLTDTTWKTPVGMDGIGEGTRRKVRHALGLVDSQENCSLGVVEMASGEKITREKTG